MAQKTTILTGAWAILAAAAERAETRIGNAHPTNGAFALARSLGVTYRTINRWAGGATRPNGAAALAVRNLAEKLGVPSPV